MEQRNSVVNAVYPLGFLNIDINITLIYLHYTILRLLCVKHIYKNPHPPNIVHSSLIDGKIEELVQVYIVYCEYCDV